MLLRPFSHGQNKGLRAELCHASDTGEESELCCFFELQQMKQTEANTAQSPRFFLMEVTGITVPTGKVS